MPILKHTILLIFLLGTTILSAQESFPEATVMNEKGESVALHEYVKSGSPKIISLWATWCGPCRMELNGLKNVADDWKEKYDLEIVTVSVDVPAMVNRARKMAETNGWDYTFMHDADQNLMANLNLRSIPHSWLVDGNGNILSVMIGYSSNYEKQLERKLKSL